MHVKIDASMNFMTGRIDGKEKYLFGSANNLTESIGMADARMHSPRPVLAKHAMIAAAVIPLL
jgi:hypothetical protein